MPITNADKLRSMTDEELAHTLLHLDGFNTFCTSFKECVRWLCFKCHREWHRVHDNPELLEVSRDELPN